MFKYVYLIKFKKIDTVSKLLDATVCALEKGNIDISAVFVDKRRWKNMLGSFFHVSNVYLYLISNGNLLWKGQMLL